MEFVIPHVIRKIYDKWGIVSKKGLINLKDLSYLNSRNFDAITATGTEVSNQGNYVVFDFVGLLQMSRFADLIQERIIKKEPGIEEINDVLRPWQPLIYFKKLNMFHFSLNPDDGSFEKRHAKIRKYLKRRPIIVQAPVPRGAAWAELRPAVATDDPVPGLPPPPPSPPPRPLALVPARPVLPPLPEVVVPINPWIINPSYDRLQKDMLSFVVDEIEFKDTSMERNSTEKRWNRNWRARNMPEAVKYTELKNLNSDEEESVVEKMWDNIPTVVEGQSGIDAWRAWDTCQAMFQNMERQAYNFTGGSVRAISQQSIRI